MMDPMVSRIACVTFLAVSMASAGCDRQPTPASTTVAPPPAWPGALATKEGKGWFELTTGASSQSAPLSHTACAHWTLFYDGEPRVFIDEWPRDGVALTVDGQSIVVDAVHIVWETPPSLSKDYLPADSDAPAKVREMLTAREWMGHPSNALPSKVTATEHCLAPSTKYRAELRKAVTPRSPLDDGVIYAAPGPSSSSGAETISYSLAIAPAI
jgi:hypothetical protein